MAKYKFDNDIRLFFNGNNEIRIRAGLWNYNEAIIDLSPYKDNVKDVVINILKELNENEFDPNSIATYQIPDSDKEEINQLVNGLYQAGMIYSSENLNIKERVTSSILGQMKDSLVESDLKDSKVLFVCDSKYCLKLAQDLCKEIRLDIDFEGIEYITNVTKYDLTTKYDAYETEKALTKLGSFVKNYDSIVISLKHININFLRNMNRLALEYEKTLSAGFIDGPFITALSTNPQKTGCFECFETRILARLEDHVLYERYVKEDKTREGDIDPSKSIISSILTNLLVSEAFLLKNYSLTKFEGRVLSIFVPSLEIQVQDILRVPYCPACGNISRAKFEEINIESRVMVNDILKDLK